MILWTKEGDESSLDFRQPYEVKPEHGDLPDGKCADAARLSTLWGLARAPPWRLSQMALGASFPTDASAAAWPRAASSRRRRSGPSQRRRRSTSRWSTPTCRLRSAPSPTTTPPATCAPPRSPPPTPLVHSREWGGGEGEGGGG